MIGDIFSDDWVLERRTGHRLRRYDVAGRAFGVALAVPPTVAPDEGCALLLLTDAALHFDAVASAAAALARRPGKTGVGQTIVAGIVSGPGWAHDADRRAQDLVPGEAGAAALSDLICQRIRPDLAAVLPIDPRKSAIFGHSLGGLFALNMLVRAPDLFRSGIAISPSLWRLPDLVGTLADGLAAQALTGQAARIFIASGEEEPAKMNDALPGAAEALARHATVEQHLFPGEDHGSVPFAAIPAALRFLHAAA